MAQHKNQGTRAQLNTLTTARKELTLDDLTMIRNMCKMFEELVAEKPEVITEHFFSSWMRATCSEVDDGTRKIGSSTKQMLEFYSDQAEGLRRRITEAQVQE